MHTVHVRLQPSDSVAYDIQYFLFFRFSSALPLFPCLLPQHLSFPFLASSDVILLKGEIFCHC